MAGTFPTLETVGTTRTTLQDSIVSLATTLATLWSEYGSTFTIEMSVFISQLSVYKLASRFLGKEGFSEYAVARRIIAVICPLALLGLMVALPRFIAHSREDGGSNGRVGYLGAALCCVVVTTGTILGLSILLPGRLAVLFVGDRNFAQLVFPLSVTIVGLTFHTIMYAFFRGNLAMRWANTLQFINLGLVPPLIFIVQRHNVRAILFELGTVMFFVAGVTMFATAPWREVMFIRWWRVKELLRYGLQRLPGDLALLGLFILPVTITAHSSGVQQAGLVAFGMVFLTIVSAMINPLGLILLPKASLMFDAGKSGELQDHLVRLVKVVVALTGVISIVLGLLTNPLIRIYLGPEFSPAVSVVRLVLLSTVPYSLFLLLSHVIDAFHRNSVTAGIEITAFLVASLGSWTAWVYFRNAKGFLLAFFAGTLTLAILASIACLNIFRDRASPPSDPAATLSSGSRATWADGPESFSIEI